MARILIASEDVGLLAVLSAEVAAEGHEVLEAMDGRDAVELSTSQGVDLVFLDFALPIFNGIEVCKLLRADPDLPSNLPVILVTNEDIDVHTRDRTRITELLPKAHLMHDVRDLLAEHLGAKARG